MATYGEIRKWDAGLLDDSGVQLKRSGDRLVGLSDELDDSGNLLGWVGNAAEMAVRNLEVIRDRMEHVVAEVNAARSALFAASDDVAILRREVMEVDELARVNSFVVDDQGNVVDHGNSLDVPAEERARIRVEILERVKEIISRAKDIDERLSHVLDKVHHGQISDGGATTLIAASVAGGSQGSLHDELLSKYQVSVDPDGMVTWPSGVTGWLADKLGHEPMEMTAGEARHLEDIGTLGARDAYGIYKTALHDAENVFDGHGTTDGHSDAFRHAYWNAMLSHRFGDEWTESYTTAHERRPDTPATAEAMDLHNNEVGRRIAAENPDVGPEDLKQLIEQAVENGEMVVVSSEGRLVPSDEVALGETGKASDPPGKGGFDPHQEDYGHWSGGYNPGNDGDTYGTADGDGDY